MKLKFLYHKLYLSSHIFLVNVADFLNILLEVFYVFCLYRSVPNRVNLSQNQG